MSFQVQNVTPMRVFQSKYTVHMQIEMRHPHSPFTFWILRWEIRIVEAIFSHADSHCSRELHMWVLCIQESGSLEYLLLSHRNCDSNCPCFGQGTGVPGSIRVASCAALSKYIRRYPGL